MFMKKQEEVKKILDKMAKIPQDKIPSNNDRIDFKKLPDVPEVKEAIKKLRDLKVNGEWLFENGFVSAGMLLGKIL